MLCHFPSVPIVSTTLVTDQLSASRLFDDAVDLRDHLRHRMGSISCTEMRLLFTHEALPRWHAELLAAHLLSILLNDVDVEDASEPVRILERGGAYLYPSARAEDRISGGHTEGLFDAWSNLYRRFAIAMEKANKGETADFWYPDVHAGAEGVKWVEKCVESAKKGAVWVKY